MHAIPYSAHQQPPFLLGSRCDGEDDDRMLAGCYDGGSAQAAGAGILSLTAGDGGKLHALLTSLYLAVSVFSCFPG